jgi:TatD DNase family protein
MFIDVHCHITYYSNEKIKDIIDRARKQNVSIIVENAVDSKDFSRILDLSIKYPEIKAVLGIYPIDALKLNDEELDEKIEFIRKNSNNIIAIGEVGLDLKWSKELEKQKKQFKKFIDLAIELDKPIIIHSRQAEKEAISILLQNKAKKVVMHCFNLDKQNLIKKIVKVGWFFSIPTYIGYSKTFQNLVKEVPIENLLCETDSPYLHPIRGKRDNEPGNVIESYKKIAEIKGLNLQEVEQKIEENFKRLFGNV